MGTTADKLNAVLESKEAIRQAIEYRGVDIPMDTTLDEYADKIGEIPTGGTLTDEQALVFIGECAEGKRKIAKALTQKYEPTTEYETFDEMAEKIKTLPLEIREDIPQPYSIVWNEMQKAFAQFGGEGIYCCAMELTKWDYDKEDTITLSGANAYYTSEGKYVTQNGEYQFDDLYADNAMRYVIYFFDHKDYTIPLDLPAVAVTNIYCLNGCPKFPIGNIYTNLFGIYSYTRDKYIVADKNDLYLYSLSSLVNCVLCGIEEMRGGQIYGCGKTNPAFPDLERIDGGSQLFYTCSGWYNFYFPKLQYVNTNYFCYSIANVRVATFPELVEMKGQYFFATTSKMNYLRLIDMPKLEKYSGDYFRINGDTECTINVPNLMDCSKGLIYSYNTAQTTIKLGNQRGVIIKILSGATTTSIVNITIEKGFATSLDLTGCNGLEHDVLLGIINNLADLTGETSLNLIMGSTLLEKLTDEDKAIATSKNWTLS